MKARRRYAFGWLILCWFILSACASDELAQHDRSYLSLAAPAPTECAGRFALNEERTAFAFRSENCDVSLTKATVRLRVQRNNEWLTVRAADYPGREVTQTSDGWSWTLAGLAGAPDVRIDISLNEKKNSVVLRPAVTWPTTAVGMIRLAWIELPNAARDGAGVELSVAEGDASWIQNGYDSWSFTGVEDLDYTGTQPGTYNGTVKPCANNYDYLTTCRGRSWWFGGLGGKDRSAGLLWGALTARSWKTYAAGWYEGGNGLIRLVIVQGTPGDERLLSPGETLTLEPVWLMLAARPANDLGRYAAAAAAETPPLDASPATPFGWGTWYDYFSQIDAATVLANCRRLLELFPEEPGMVCQIDDGYETLFGEYESYTEGFPEGVAPVAGEIRALGLTPGIWLAPLLVDERSALLDEHPEWFLLNRDGEPVVFHDLLSSKWFRVLDVTEAGAAAHLREMIATKVGEGFGYLKLDFLFAGAYEAAYADGSTSLEAYHRAMEIIREAAGANVFLLASGEPWLPSLGHVHAARDSSDVGGAFPGIPLYTTMVNLARYHGVRGVTDGVWFANDPDNLVIREPLTDSQAELSMAMTYLAGPTLLGDSLVELSTARTALATSAAAEGLRQTTGSFWAIDLFSESVLWPIATPAFDLAMVANAAPRIWVRAADDTRVVGLFSWGLLNHTLTFTDRELDVDFSGGVTIEQLFGEIVDLTRSENGDWTCRVPGQSAVVFRLAPTAS